MRSIWEQWPKLVLVLCGLAALGVLSILLIRPRGLDRLFFERLAFRLPDCQAAAQLRETHCQTGSLRVAALLGPFERGEPVEPETVHALRRLGSSAAPELIAAFEDRNGEVRIAAARAISLLGRELGSQKEAAVAGLIEMAKDPETDVRYAGVLALGYMGRDKARAILTLVNALKDSDRAADGSLVYVRATAARVLGGIGPGACLAVPELARLLSDTNSYTRQQAALALSRINPRQNPLPRVIADLLAAHLPRCESASTAENGGMLGRYRSSIGCGLGQGRARNFDGRSAGD